MAGIILGRNRDYFSVAAFSGILYGAVDKGVKRIVFGVTDIFPGVDSGASLTNDYRAGVDLLPAEYLNTQSLSV
jgi:hypothetical protein